MDIQERLKRVRKCLKLTQGEFGKAIGVSDVTISTAESGKTRLSDRNIRLICLTFGISESWLRTGEGEMFLLPPEVPKEPILDDDGRPLPSDEAEELFMYRQLDQPGRDDVRRYTKQMLDLLRLRAEGDKSHGHRA